MYTDTPADRARLIVRQHFGYYLDGMTRWHASGDGFWREEAQRARHIAAIAAFIACGRF